MMTDPIADMLVRINNACAMRHETVEVPSSKSKTVKIAVLVLEDGTSTVS